MKTMPSLKHFFYLQRVAFSHKSTSLMPWRTTDFTGAPSPCRPGASHERVRAVKPMVCDDAYRIIQVNFHADDGPRGRLGFILGGVWSHVASALKSNVGERSRRDEKNFTRISLLVPVLVLGAATVAVPVHRTKVTRVPTRLDEQIAP